MKILIVTQYFWPENFRINDLASGLKEKGHNVVVLTGIPNYPDGRFFQGYGAFKKRVEDYQGIKIVRVPLVPRGNGRALNLALNYLTFALCASIFGPFICRGKFDLIFVYEPSPITVGLPALVLKKLKTAPIMFWVQDIWPESLSATGAVRSLLLLNLIERMVRFIYRGCDRILVQSKAFFSPIESLEVDPRRIIYFPNSAEELYQPLTVKQDASEHVGLPAGFRVMFAGNIGAAQDFANILEAAEKLKGHPDIHWMIIGDGRMRPWVEAQLQERRLTKTVHLLGRQPAQAMPRYFALADVLLVSLKKEPIFALTIPSKVQSYLACAKPVIAALDGEGARVIAEAGAGLTCPAENPGALAEAVLTMYRMPETERKAMGLCGRSYFEKHFERKILLDRLDEWMKELLKEVRQCAS
ncbi:Glycosyl transferases group 1 [uncultured archaeon]|nr:Glycosyl transferases group 1 [uncultured archaeon]